MQQFSFLEAVIIALGSGALVAIVSIVAQILEHKRHEKDLALRHKEQELRERQLKLEFGHRREEQELGVSKVMLPKCLEVLQHALVHQNRMNLLLNQASNYVRQSNTSLDEVKKYEGELHEELAEIRTWFNENSLYLPNNVRGSFLAVINYSHEHVYDLFHAAPSERIPRHVWERLFELSKAIRRDFETFTQRYNLIDRILESE